MDVHDEPDKLKFLNFLKHYDLGEYYDSFLKHGVRKLSHLKHTTDEDLREIGLQRPEIARLKKKVEENFSTFGKFKKKLSGKDKQFDGTVGDVPLSPNESRLSVISDSPILIGSDQIQLLDKIGEGTHGQVYKANVTLNNKKLQVAVKCVMGLNEEAVLSSFMKEAESMVQLKHCNIIQLYGISIGTRLMMVEELAPLGNLNLFLKKHSEKIHLGKLYTYALQVACAMCYLEERKIIHRDLASRNVLLMNQNHVKLGDFGLARRLTESSNYQLTRTGVPLPAAWMPPEAINEGIFSTSSDVWSFGVFVWELYTKGDKPWEGYKAVEIKDRLETGERLKQPTICPSILYQLLNQCWALESKERPTFAQLYKKLQEPKYRPEVALVTTSHYLEGELPLKKDDLLFILDKRRKDLWVGMTLDGRTGSFLRDCVTCDSMKLKEQPVVSHDQATAQLADDQHLYSSIHMPDEQYDIPSNLPYHYETRENNPGVEGTDSSSQESSHEESPYIKMKSNILDAPTAVANLPPPIVPTAEALQNLMNASESKKPSIYTDMFLEEPPSGVNVESMYCLATRSNVETSDSPLVIPPLVPPRKPNTSQQSSPTFSPFSQSHRPASPHQTTDHVFPVADRRMSHPSSSVQHEDTVHKLLVEFPDTDPETCRNIVHKANGDISKGRKELKVRQLMGMGFPYIKEDDCIRALDHCQDKTERAAGWLLELSETISTHHHQKS